MVLSTDISNSALHFSMEFGENWLKPIQERLSKLYPGLSNYELDQFNALCKQVNKVGNDFVFSNPIRNKETMEFVAIEKFRSFMIERYSWINEENLNKLYSQSCYYAWK